MNKLKSFFYAILLSIHATNSYAASGIVSTIAGTGVPAYSGDGGPGTLATINNPCGIVIDNANNIYFSDTLNHRVRKVGTNGIITTIAGTGAPGFAGDGGPATQAQFNEPHGISMDELGNLYIADLGNHCIRRVDTQGIITTVAGVGGEAGGGAQNGLPATTAKLFYPHSVFHDKNGHFYITDRGNNRIRQVDANGIITSVAGGGVPGGPIRDGIVATMAVLNGPNSVFKDTDGNLLIADALNNRIRRVDTSGIITTVVGTGSTWNPIDGIPAVESTIASPFSVFKDQRGEMYITDTGNHRVRKVDLNGIITTIAGSASPVYEGDGGPADQTRLRAPHSIIKDSQDNILITEWEGHRVRKIQGNGNLPGDYNHDCQVDQLDHDIWKANFDTNNPAADSDGDGQVNAADYIVWKKYKGTTCVVAGSAAAPNTSSLESAAVGQTATPPSNIPDQYRDGVRDAHCCTAENTTEQEAVEKVSREVMRVNNAVFNPAHGEKAEIVLQSGGTSAAFHAQTAAADVRIMISDRHGRTVADFMTTMHNGSVTWDGRNQSQETVVSDVYFGRIIRADRVDKFKVVIIK